MLFPQRAELLPSDRRVTFAAWSNLFLIGSRAAEVDETFDLCTQNFVNLLRKHPRGVGFLLVVLHNERPPENYLARVVELLRTYRPQIRCCCAVLEGRGFAGAAQRALAQSVVSLSGVHATTGIYTDLTEASSFVAERVLPAEHRAQGQVALLGMARAFRDEMLAEMARAGVGVAAP